MFWTWACLLLLVVVLVLLWPLLMTKARGLAAGLDLGSERQKANLQAHQQQLRELEQQHSEGRIDANEFAERQQSIKLRLLRDADSNKAKHVDVGSTSLFAKRLAIVIVLLLPVAAFLLYGQVGQPELARGGLQSVTAKARLEPENVAANRLAESLAAEVQRRPTDAAAWLALGQTYLKAKRVPAAKDAFEQANKLTGYRNAEAVLALAETSVSLQGGNRFAGRPSDLIEHALKLQPQSPKALWLGGLAAVDAQKLELAIQRWRLLSQQEHPQAFQAVIARAIAVTEQKLAARAGSEQEPQNSGSDSKVAVSVAIRLADKLQGRFATSTPVFVYAKAVNGPPMPLAARRLTVGDLPTTVTLSDAQSMMPNLKMSAFDQWLVAARVSVSGDASPKSGDWVAEQTVKAATAAQSVILTISQQLP